MYKNETAFVRAIVSACRKQGFAVQRIESHSTGYIPDMLIAGMVRPYPEAPPDTFCRWVEAKIVHAPIAIGGETINRIPYRPGQQAFMLDWYIKTSVPPLTFVAFDDCIGYVVNKRAYEDGKVPTSEICYYSNLSDLFVPGRLQDWTLAC